MSHHIVTNDDGDLDYFCEYMAAKLRTINDVDVQLEVLERTQAYLEKIIKRANPNPQIDMDKHNTVLKWISGCDNAS